MEVNMADQPWDAQTRLALGCSILAFALPALFLIVINNVGYVNHSYGWPVLIAYLAAAWAVLMLPFLKAYFGHTLHLRITQFGAVALVAWITLEENLHAAEGWKAPAGATSLAQVAFEPETAQRFVLFLFVLLIFGILEALAHFAHEGAHLVWCWWCEKNAPPKRSRSKKTA
jgi:hypothetical protein